MQAISLPAVPHCADLLHCDSVALAEPMTATGEGCCPPGPGNNKILAFRDLELQRQDVLNKLWVAEANDVTSVQTTQHCLEETQAAVAVLQGWLMQIPVEFMQKLQQRFQRLVHGDIG